MTEAQTHLIERAKAGDRRAFGQLVEEHYDMIYRVSYKLSGNAGDAADIAQEVCVRLAKTLSSFRGNSKFSTWLYQVTVNVFRDARKSAYARHTREALYVELAEAETADAADTMKKSVWLYRSLATLGPPLPETALLVLAENLSHAEAGKVLGCAESTVSWRMHEVRKKLTLMAERDAG